MICINFYGGPGIGKSTMAAKMFAALKTAGVKTELVGEFAKDLVYDRAYNVMADQHYLFAQQAHRLWRLDKYGVEVAVCDSPLLLALAYNKDPQNGCFTEFAIDTYKRYTNFDYVLGRNPVFWEKDKRSGDVERGIQVDNKIDAILLDVWHDFPEKLNVDDPVLVEDFITSVVLRVKDTLKENAIIEELKARKTEHLSDEPWKVA